MSDKLSVQTSKKRLIAEAEAERVKAVKLALSSRKAGEVAKPKMGGEPKTTKITQITVSSRDVRNDKPASGGQSFKTSSRADKIVDETPRLKMKQTGGDGAPSRPSIKNGIRPNQEAHLKQVSKPIKDKAVADDNGGGKEFIPAREKKYPDQKAFAVPAGRFASTNNRTPVVPKQDAASVKRPAPKMARVNMAPREELPTIQPTKVKKHTGFSGDPSDAPARVQKIAKPIRGAENLVESGIELRLNGKTKAHFEIVSPQVVRRMVESYRRHGIKLEVVRADTVWSRDKNLLGHLWEAMDAQYNGVQNEYQRLRGIALNRFKQIVQHSYNDLYESRQHFLKLIDEAFKKVELNARKRYVEGLELMTCTARVQTKHGKADLEMITEAHTDQMALRQIQNKLHEQYGLGISIDHIFIDGKKYKPSDIEAWTGFNESTENDLAQEDQMDETESDDGAEDDDALDEEYVPDGESEMDKANSDNNMKNLDTLVS